MPFIRYTTQVQMLDSRLDFHVYPGVFELDFYAVQEHLVLKLKSIKTMHPHWFLQEFKHAKTCVDELDRLRPLIEEQAVIALSDSLTAGLSETAAVLICDKLFRAAICPICDKSFSAEELLSHEWAFGEALAAAGGERFTCPSGHTLISVTHWQS